MSNKDTSQSAQGGASSPLVGATHKLGQIHGLRAALLEGNYKRDFPLMYFEDFGKSPLAGLAQGDKFLRDNQIDTSAIEPMIAELAADVPEDYPDKAGINLTGTWQLGYYKGVATYWRMVAKAQEEDFAAWLMAARKKKGWSQARLAKEVGATQPQISTWEKGQITPGDAMKATLRDILADK